MADCFMPMHHPQQKLFLFFFRANSLIIKTTSVHMEIMVYCSARPAVTLGYIGLARFKPSTTHHILTYCSTPLPLKLYIFLMKKLKCNDNVLLSRPLHLSCTRHLPLGRIKPPCLRGKPVECRKGRTCFCANGRIAKEFSTIYYYE